MDHAHDKIRYGVEHSAEIGVHASVETRSDECLICQPAAAGPNDSQIDATPGAGLLVRGLIVDAILNQDCTIREFHIRRPE